MIYALTQNRKELDDGTPVSPPIELQLGWLMNRWGVEVLGQDADFKQIIKSDRALAVHRALDRDQKHRTDDDWQIISDVMRIIGE